MNEEWKIRNLNEVCEVRPSKPQVKKKLDEDAFVTYAPMDDLGIDQKYFSGNEERTMGDAYKGYTYFEEGDVVLAKITPCFENGKLGIARNLKNGIGFGSTEFIPYRTGDELLPEYLYYYLNQSSFRKEGERLMTGAVGHKRLPKDFYEEYKIPVPPLDEQKRIVAILDEAFDAIGQVKDNIERNIENVGQLFKSRLNKVFSQITEDSDEKTLGEIYSFRNGINFTKDEKNEIDNEGILTIDVYNMYRGGLSVDLSDLYRVDKQVKESYKLKKGDILFVRSSLKKEGVAWTTYFTEHEEDVTYCGFIIRGRPKTYINPKYTVYYCRSPKVRDELIDRAVESTITNINQKLLSQVVIPFPDEERQSKIVQEIKEFESLTDELKAYYQDRLKALKELKKSILQQAFSGELTKKEELVA